MMQQRVSGRARARAVARRAERGLPWWLWAALALAIGWMVLIGTAVQGHAQTVPEKVSPNPVPGTAMPDVQKGMPGQALPSRPGLGNAPVIRPPSTGTMPVIKPPVSGTMPVIKPAPRGSSPVVPK